ncbi:MAG: TVP38/TMEM64 family protein [Candidatus Sumerlaeaceae bacterium]
MTPSKPKQRWLKDALRILLVAAIFGTTAYVLSLPQVRTEFFDVAHVRNLIQSRGQTGLLLFIAVAALVIGLGVPRLWVSALAGGLFGASMGTVVGQLASILGAIITFYIARFILRSVLVRRMPPRMRVWYDRINRRGFFWLFYIRLFPFANATVTNLIGGVSQVSLGTFLIATFLGYLPETIIFAIFGSSAAKKDSVQFAIAFGALVVFLAIERTWQYLRKRRGALAQEEELAETQNLEEV